MTSPRSGRADAKGKSGRRQPALGGKAAAGEGPAVPSSVVEDTAARAMPAARGRPQGMELVVQLGFAEVVVELAFLFERRPRRTEIGELEMHVVADVLAEG